MAVFYADGATEAQANVGIGHAYLETTDHTGRVRLFYDDFTVGSTAVPLGIVAADEIVIGGGPIPKGSRILGGFFSNSDISGSAGTASIRFDIEANVGTVTPAGEMRAHEAASLDVSAANSGALLAWDVTADTPYQILTPVDYFVWVAPSGAESYDVAGTMSISIFYVYD